MERVFAGERIYMRVTVHGRTFDTWYTQVSEPDGSIGSMKRILTALQVNPVAASIQDVTNGDFIAVNDAFCLLTGYTANELLTQDHEVSDFFVEVVEHEHIVMLSREKRSFRNLDIKLRNLSEQVTLRGGPKCSLVVETTVPDLEPEIATHLYRISQEAVNNATKHAGAKSIVIYYCASNGRITLRVEDDGTGMPVDDSLTGGMGLHIMEYRANMIGASLEIKRGLNGGTLVTCSMPLEKQPVGVQ